MWLTTWSWDFGKDRLFGGVYKRDGYINIVENMIGRGPREVRETVNKADEEEGGR